MTDNYTEEDDYQDDGEETPEETPAEENPRTVTLSYEDAKRLRQAAKKGRRVDELEAELAVRDSGLKLSPEQRQALFAIHKGPRTAEAIAETAEKLGWGAPAEASDEDVQAERAIADATSTATPKLAQEELSPEDLRLSAKEARVRRVSGQWDEARYEKFMRARYPELVGTSS